ncbi:MAG: efflux RND transporter periplasmic adaptor subunit [Pseudomonadota bacterium]
MGKRLLRWGIIVAVIALALVIYNNQRKKSAEETEKGGSATSAISTEGRPKEGGRGRSGRGGLGGGVVPVKVAKVYAGEMDRIIEALGTVTPLNTVTVRSRVDGVLEKVLFQEGQVVKAGQWLAQIDPIPLSLQVQQAEGVVQRDIALLQNAKADLVRYETLLQQDSGSKQQRDTQAALVRQYEATLKVDRALLENARVQKNYTRIVAPVSGRIGLRQIDPGNLIKAGDAGALAVITQLAPISVVFSVPQDRLTEISTAAQSNAHLSVTLYDRDASSPKAVGKLLAIDNQIDINTGTVKLKAQFDNAINDKTHAVLFPNQFINVGLQVEHLTNVTLIPAEALQRGATDSFVYVVKPDQSVTVRPVVTGLTRAGKIIITKGLAVGELVVTEGIDRLKEGAKVKVVSPNESKSGEGHNGSHNGSRQGGAHRGGVDVATGGVAATNAAGDEAEKSGKARHNRGDQRSQRTQNNQPVQ